VTIHDCFTNFSGERDFFDSRKGNFDCEYAYQFCISCDYTGSRNCKYCGRLSLDRKPVDIVLEGQTCIPRPIDTLDDTGDVSPMF
jgi:hypothetical protein